MAESEYGGLVLSTVVVVERYVIFMTKIKGGVQYEVKLLKFFSTPNAHFIEHIKC
jgi:hypothetical protein